MPAPIIATESCSKWYGEVLGLSDLNWTVHGGIIGLLGPNGAGKSTLMKLVTGLLRPSRGSVRIFGEDPRTSPKARKRIGYCPEHDGLYDELTALEIGRFKAELSGLGKQSLRAAEQALDRVGLSKSQNRQVAGFSKGMRQRTKLAQCMVHDPDLIILDEPLTGVDPVARAAISEQIQALGAAGKTVVLSTHVLYEVEALTEEIAVIFRGQILAEGNVYAIRELIDRRPHRIRVECDKPRALAAALVAEAHVLATTFEEGAVTLETDQPDRCYARLTELVVQNGVTVKGLTSPDNNLGAVFSYLTGGVQ